MHLYISYEVVRYCRKIRVECCVIAGLANIVGVCTKNGWYEGWHRCQHGMERKNVGAGMCMFLDIAKCHCARICDISNCMMVENILCYRSWAACGSCGCYCACGTGTAVITPNLFGVLCGAILCFDREVRSFNRSVACCVMTVSLFCVQIVPFFRVSVPDIMNMSPKTSALPPWTEEDLRKTAPRLPDGGPKQLPDYLQQHGQLDLHQALWMWMGYRQEEWQRADVRVSRLLGKQSGNWYWTLEIILPIAGKPGLEIRGLAHAVARVPSPEVGLVPAAANNVSAVSKEEGNVLSTPPRQQSTKRVLDDAHDDDPEAKRVMRIIESLASSPGNVFSKSPQIGSSAKDASCASMSLMRTL